MKKQNKNQEGIAHIVVILLIAVIALVVVASAGAYYFLKLKGQSYVSTTQTGQNYMIASPSPTPISKSDKTTDLQNDLNSTNLNSVDTDLNRLDAASKSL